MRRTSGGVLLDLCPLLYKLVGVLSVLGLGVEVASGMGVESSTGMGVGVPLGVRGSNRFGSGAKVLMPKLPAVFSLTASNG